jgi:hypothetical protein
MFLKAPFKCSSVYVLDVHTLGLWVWSVECGQKPFERNPEIWKYGNLEIPNRGNPGNLEILRFHAKNVYWGNREIRRRFKNE